MGAFKEIATKLMFGTVNKLSEDEIIFLWVYARNDYYKLTGRKSPPKGWEEEKKEIKENQTTIQGVFNF